MTQCGLGTKKKHLFNRDSFVEIHINELSEGTFFTRDQIIDIFIQKLYVLRLHQYSTSLLRFSMEVKELHVYIFFVLKA